MTRRDHDEWRLPSVESFGAQFRAREEPAHQRSRVRLRARLSAGAVVAAIAGTIAVLELVTPAGARSPVSEAPARARKSATVAFESTIDVALNHRVYASVREQGAVDFRHGASRTTTLGSRSHDQVERMTIGSDLYIRRVPRHRPAKGSRWSRLHYASTSSSARSQGQTLLDPEVVFTVLERVRGPVLRVDRRGAGGPHYRLVTTLQEFLHAEYGGIDEPKVAGGTLAVLDVWLDADGRPASVSARFTGSSRLGSGMITFHARYGDYGKTLGISAPPLVAATHVSHPTAPFHDPIRLFESLLFPPRRASGAP